MGQGGPVGTSRLPGRDGADGVLPRPPDPSPCSPALPVAWDLELQLQEQLGLLKTRSSYLHAEIYQCLLGSMFEDLAMRKTANESIQCCLCGSSALVSLKHPLDSQGMSPVM